MFGSLAVELASFFLVPKTRVSFLLGAAEAISFDFAHSETKPVERQLSRFASAMLWEPKYVLDVESACRLGRVVLVKIEICSDLTCLFHLEPIL